MFTSEEMAVIKLIAHQQAQEVLIDTMKGMATVSGAGSNTSTGDSSILISKSFDDVNPETMEQKINEWLQEVQATDIHHMNCDKNPNTNFGVIKTIFVKVPRSVAMKEIQKPE